MKEIRTKLENGFSKRGIAIDMGIAESTLRKRLKCGTIPPSLGRFTTVFSPEKKQLALYVKEMDKRFYGVTLPDLMTFLMKVIISEENTLAWEGNFDLATGLPISEVPNIPDLFDRPQKDEDMGSSRISVEYTTPEKKDTPSEKDNPAQENSLVKDVKLEEIRPFPKHKQTDKVKVRQSQKS
ncbi:hypothetical protein ILUMI_14843 [Ignelater luminosus]|uniref:Uncharacterized protein n=1 Tax=Ignelater luminosus TaxID=2038154 RepID=A0A8K0G4G4_IGNLU|nr:hypothetical protein ILUMI_14843 [Ignelater luminosus]